jgi:succinylglutamic semialdehyde dehydrogenase
VASRLTVGGPAAEPAPFMGPVVSAAVAKRLVQAQADMVAKGGKLLLEMRQLDENTGFVTAGIVDVTDAKASLTKSGSARCCR